MLIFDCHVNQSLGSSRTGPRETKSGLERNLAWLLLKQSPWLSPSCHLLVILHELFFNWDPILPTCHSQLASVGPRWKVKFQSTHWFNTWNKFEAQWRQSDLQIAPWLCWVRNVFLVIVLKDFRRTIICFLQWNIFRVTRPTSGGAEESTQFYSC